MLVFFTTPWLSQKTFAGPKRGTPIDINLSLVSTIKSLAILIATSSDPKVLYSTVFCLLLNDLINALFRNMNTPVCDRRVTTLLA